MRKTLIFIAVSDTKDIEKIEGEIEKEIHSAVTFARESPRPGPEILYNMNDYYM